MKKTLLIVALGLACATLPAHELSAQDVVGDWQGLFKGTSPAPDLRIVVHIAKSTSGDLIGTFYSIDQPPEGIDGVALATVNVQGGVVRFVLGDRQRGMYEGKLSPDGNSMTGTWTGLRVRQLELSRATKETAWPHEIPRHAASFVSVDKDVQLEVLDFGGSGRPIVFLAGLGATAHVFDQFAPRFIASHHVYGITRRGFGASSAPPPSSGNYSADRLGDDILAVLDSLGLDRPVLVGHSIAGEELSSIGSRHPEKVSGLIYLDAGYSYAYYDRSRGDYALDAIELKEKLEQLLLGKAGGGPHDPLELIQSLLRVKLPQIESDLREYANELRATTSPSQPPHVSAIPAIVQAIFDGQQKYENIPVPTLSFFAIPHAHGDAFKNDSVARASLEDWDTRRMEAIATAFARGLPSSRVVRLAHADHFVIKTHEAEVAREMDAFLGRLP